MLIFSHVVLPARNVICKCVLINSSLKTFIEGVYVSSPVCCPEISLCGQELEVSVGRSTVLGESQDGM